MLQIQWFHRSVEESYISHSFKEGNQSLTLPLSCPYLCWGHFWWGHFWWRMDPIGRLTCICRFQVRHFLLKYLHQSRKVIGHAYVLWLVMYMFC